MTDWWIDQTKCQTQGLINLFLILMCWISLKIHHLVTFNDSLRVWWCPLVLTFCGCGLHHESCCLDELGPPAAQQTWNSAIFSVNYSRISMEGLTHWGRVTHLCISKLTIIGSDNGLSPDRAQAIIWTNAGLLLIGPLGTNFSEILIKIITFS